LHVGLIKEMNEKICDLLKSIFNECWYTTEIFLNRHRANVLQNIQKGQTGWFR